MHRVNNLIIYKNSTEQTIVILSFNMGRIIIRHFSIGYDKSQQKNVHMFFLFILF